MTGESARHGSPLPARDGWAALLVAAISLFVYSLTLAPSVAAGDIAELQYIPARLGIPHPNGYPFYILLGWLWSWLPFATLAWGMNLLSAVLGALGVGLAYLLLRVTGLSRSAALTGALLWAFQRTFWLYAGLAHRYTLLMLLGTAFLFALLLWRQRGELRFFFLAALLVGLGTASHIATPLFFLPGVFLLLGPGGAKLPRVKLLVWAALLALLPLLLYAYIPLRGTALWNASPVNQAYGLPLAVLQGIIHPRFAPNAATIWHYFTAGSPGSVGQVLAGAAGNVWFVPLLIQQEIGGLWLVVALAGLLLVVWRDRVWGAALWSLLLADLLLAFYYRQGNVEAYFLPAAFVLVVGLAELLHRAQRLLLFLTSYVKSSALGRWLAVGIALAGLLLPLAFLSRNWETADQRAELSTDSYWRTVLALELEEGAGLVAHWSDLTPLWYFQQAEEQRPDLLGLYLPDLAQIRAGLAGGGAVYLAGPLAGWYINLQQEMRLIPWGPLVRLVLPAEPAPAIPQSGSVIDRTLGGALTLRTAALPAQTPLPAGATVPLTLTWSSLSPVPRDLHISLRLRQQGQLAAQQDDRIISPWFALDTVEPGLDFWSLYALRIPEGLRPGAYELGAVVYALGGPELSLDGGGAEMNLGTLTVAPQIIQSRSFLPTTTIAPCLELVSVTADGATALIGSPFGVRLLWQADCQPTADVGLRFFLQNGAVTRALETQPLDAAYPPTAWQRGQRVLTQSVLRLSADLSPGPAILTLEAVDVANGEPLRRGWGPLPLPGRIQIAALSLTTRAHATEAPALAHVADASFGGQIRLLGYEIAADAIVAGGPLTVTLAWQTERAMDVSYSLFLHLLDADGQIVAQRDGVPHDGQLPTSIWLPGEVVTDSYILQPEQPLTQGTYTLITGLYEPSSGQRLPVTQDGSSGDFFRLGGIALPPK